MITVDPVKAAALAKAKVAAEIDQEERELLLPKMLRLTIILSAEKEAIAAGAARTPALTPAQSLEILRSDTGSGYSQVRAIHLRLEAKRIEAGL